MAMANDHYIPGSRTFFNILPVMFLDLNKSMCSRSIISRKVVIDLAQQKIDAAGDLFCAFTSGTATKWNLNKM
jgi:hypothetical protein